MKKPRSSLPNRKPFSLAGLYSPGFSLIELLVVIAVIAIMASIAIPGISGIIGSVNRGRDQRNAQTLAGLASEARGYGHEPWATKSAAIEDLTTGFSMTNSQGPSYIVTFRLDTMSTEDKARAAAYLDSNGQTLIYVPSGGQSTNL